MAQAPENWGRNPNRRRSPRSQRLSGGRSLRRRWVSPPQKNFKKAYLKPCILVYSWSENLYFSHRIQEFSEEWLKPNFDFLFQLLNNKFWQESRKFNRKRHRTHRLEIENRKFFKCSDTNFHHNRRDLQIIAFSGNSSIFEHPEHPWTPKLNFTLLNNATKYKKCYFSYIKSVKTQISHAVTSMQVQKKYFKSWLGGFDLAEGGFDRNSRTPLATGMWNVWPYHYIPYI